MSSVKSKHDALESAVEVLTYALEICINNTTKKENYEELLWDAGNKLYSLLQRAEVTIKEDLQQITSVSQLEGTNVAEGLEYHQKKLDEIFNAFRIGMESYVVDAVFRETNELSSGNYVAQKIVPREAEVMKSIPLTGTMRMNSLYVIKDELLRALAVFHVPFERGENNVRSICTSFKILQAAVHLLTGRTESLVADLPPQEQSAGPLALYTNLKKEVHQHVKDYHITVEHLRDLLYLPSDLNEHIDPLLEAKIYGGKQELVDISLREAETKLTREAIYKSLEELYLQKQPALIREGPEEWKHMPHQMDKQGGGAVECKAVTSPKVDMQVGLYKTQLCKNWVQVGGTCPYGPKCRFAHGEQELRQPVCSYVKHDIVCPRGDKCRFSNVRPY